jgi:diguanylate cyclase (GGDEF)-like protein
VVPRRDGAAQLSRYEYVQENSELRTHIARFLGQRATPVVDDAVAVLPFAGLVTAQADSHRVVAERTLQLLAFAARDGGVEAHRELLAELCQAAENARLGIAQLFRIVYVVERAALDELALDESFGATSEPWSVLDHIVRRSSFDLLAGCAERIETGQCDRALVDPLTTVHTKAVLVAALDKEIQRAERFGHPFALMVIDVDRLAEINDAQGYGLGDRVLERLGILMRKYFREQDWVARFGDDTFAVLMPETQPAHAELLAERLRTTVQARMALPDHRSDKQLPVTVSVAVVIAESVDSHLRAEDLFEEAREAMARAKTAGRNRVEKAHLATWRPVGPPRDNQLG